MSGEKQEACPHETRHEAPIRQGNPFMTYFFTIAPNLELILRSLLFINLVVERSHEMEESVRPIAKDQCNGFNRHEEIPLL